MSNPHGLPLDTGRVLVLSLGVRVSGFSNLSFEVLDTSLCRTEVDVQGGPFPHRIEGQYRGRVPSGRRILRIVFFSHTVRSLTSLKKVLCSHLDHSLSGERWGVVSRVGFRTSLCLLGVPHYSRINDNENSW